MVLSSQELVDLLGSLGACQPSLEWLRFYNDLSLPELWAKCDKGDWLLWIASVSAVDRRKLVLASCEVARTGLRNATPEELPNLRSWLEVAEDWANNRRDVSVDMLLDAFSNAANLAYVAGTVWSDEATACAAEGVAAAIAIATAPKPQHFATASSVAYSCGAPTSLDEDFSDEAMDASLQESAEIVRKHITVEMVLAGLERFTASNTEEL